MFQIENDHLQVSIKARGAELDSIFQKSTGMEYLWNADPNYWAKKSPVLFPIVGTLKDDTYFFEEKAYRLSRHGFARDMDFELANQMKNSLELAIHSNPSTLAHYPFPFQFSVGYVLEENTLQVRYTVSNTGEVPMYFSVGGHPAFKVPVKDGLQYEDYYLEFNEEENAGRWPISGAGLIKSSPIPLLQNSHQLALTKELFLQDALVFKDLKSNSVQLKTDKDSHGWRFDFTGFPYLGIWAAKQANFVCIEPWCGIADAVDTDQQLIRKEGIVLLEAGKTFEKNWSISIF